MDTCGNPLFLEWIGQWMEHARECNNRSYYIYRKAYESMAKYPTPFQHPAEAVCLAGIGEKMVEMLEKKLAEHCKANDLPYPTSKKRKSKATVVANNNEEEEPAAPKRVRQKTQKQYVPTYRSGPYAILLTLLDALTEDGSGAMTKHEITTKGQVYCDASLTNPDHGKFYTAWNSMKTILGKNLAYQNGNKYYLTEEGADIARKIRSVAAESDPTVAPLVVQPPVRSSPSSSNISEREVENFEHSWSQEVESKMSRSSSQPNPCSTSPDPSKWKFPAESRFSIGGDSMQPVNLLDDSDDEDHSYIYSSMDRPNNAMELQNSSIKTYRRTESTSSFNNTHSSSSASTLARSSSTLSRTLSTSSLRTPIPPRASDHDPFAHLDRRSNSRNPTRDFKSSQEDIAALANFEPTIYPSGSFEICLVLDIREVRTQTDRDYISQKLMERGVSVLKRKLEVGDAIWIARRIEPKLDGSDELVLDYVVERKRMDDLVSSIKDGRFNEQKFRLKRSGLGQVIYLVETYKMNGTYDIGPDAIRTAMMMTQVNDSFFLKRTNNTDHTIEYLVSMTNALIRIYKNQALYGVPNHAIDRATYLDLQDHLRETMPDRTFLTSYKSFNVLNSKSDATDVRDVFVKMLMTIRGISSEKATELAKVYGTPRAMFSALDHLDEKETHAQRRTVLARSSSNIGRKKIGPALSARVADVWYADEYP